MIKDIQENANVIFDGFICKRIIGGISDYGRYTGSSNRGKERSIKK